jgi:hypothetical protein
LPGQGTPDAPFLRVVCRASHREQEL